MTDLVTSFADRGLEYSVTDEGVAWLRLNRPEKRNAIDRPLRTAIIEAIEEVTEDPEVRVAVITGNGRAFSSGADLTQEGGPIEVPPERRRANGGREDGILYGWYRMVDRIWKSTKPFIAAVNGIAAGGGCNLALGCDLVLAADTARFTEVFVRRALGLDWGGSWLLPRLVGIQRAKQLAFFGDVVPAQEAERIGLVNEIVPAAELLPTALGWARRLADGPPLALALIKEELNASIGPPMVSALEHEATGQATSAASEDVAEGIASFLEKRPPRFVGR